MMNPFFTAWAIPKDNSVVGAFVEKSSKALCYCDGLQLIEMRG